MADIFIPAPSIYQKFTDLNGLPLSQGYIYSYKSGTNDKKETYKDALGSTINENPIRLSDEGFCQLFLKTSTSDTYEDAYRFEIYDKDKVLVRTIDNIVAIKGKDGEPYKIILVRGEQGEKGNPGASIPGPVTKGAIGPTSDTGDFLVFWNKAQTVTWIVPDKVNFIKCKLQGAGGGNLYALTPPATGNVCTGTAGEYLFFETAVDAGDVLTIIVGAGGEATTNQLKAQGGDTSIEGTSLTKRTAKGGSYGSNDGGTSSSSVYYRKLMPLINFYNIDGTILPNILRAIPGQESKFGMAGNIYTANAGKGGNGASGGSGIPSINTDGTISLSAMYAGGDGYVEIIYNVESE